MKQLTVKLAMVALFFAAVSLCSCNGDKKILEECAVSLNDDAGMRLATFGILDGVEYDAENNLLSIEVHDAKIDPQIIKANFNELAPVFLNEFFYFNQKRRSLVAKMVKSLDTKVEFEFIPTMGMGTKAEIEVPAEEYVKYNNIIVDAESELKARLIAKDQFYNFPISLPKDEKITDLGVEDGRMVVTVSINPDLIGKIKADEGQFKLHGVELITDHLLEEGKICAKGDMDIVLRFVGHNGKGTEDVKLISSVVTSRFGC